MKKAAWIVLGLVAFGCIGIFALSGGDDDKPSPVVATAVPEGAEAPADAPADAATEPPAAAPAAAKIGDSVIVGDDRLWTVSAAEDRGQLIESGNEFTDDLTTTGRFVFVAATIKNEGKDAFFIDVPKIVDGQAREFDHASGDYAFIDEAQQCILEQLNPGLDKTCAWIYEVPADAAGLKLKVGGALFDTAVDIDLGLQ